MFELFARQLTIPPQKLPGIGIFKNKSAKNRKNRKDTYSAKNNLYDFVMGRAPPQWLSGCVPASWVTCYGFESGS